MRTEGLMCVGLLGCAVGYLAGRFSRTTNKNECAVRNLEAIASGHLDSFSFADLPEKPATTDIRESDLDLKEWVARVDALTERGKANIAQLIENNRLRLEAAKALARIGDE